MPATARRLLGLGALIAVLLGAIAMFQDRLLYFPTKASVEDMASGLNPWPAPLAFRGLVSEPRDGVADALRGTVIVFHGNAGHAGQRAFYAQAMTRLGLRVVLAEYPGYGPREGEPGEEALTADAAHTIALAHRLYGGELLVIGESLGAAVAASAAARQSAHVAGLLLITPWDRLENVAAHHYPWLPVKWLLRDRYDTTRNLQSFTGPVVIVLAEQDEIVPARLGLALHEELGRPNPPLAIAGAGHNDWPALVDDAWWRRALAPLFEKPAPATR